MSAEKVFRVLCPCCGAVVWVDAASGNIVKSEKVVRKKPASLDDLLVKEQKKVEGFATKFEATADLERQKKEKAKEAFEKALEKAGEEKD
jgi:hypothetical protein